VRLELRIDRLVIDGPDLSRREREGLAAMIEQELAVTLTRAPVGRRSPPREPGARIARDVARAVHGALPPGTAR
jgi:hypothetical protein